MNTIMPGITEKNETHECHWDTRIPKSSSTTFGSNGNEFLATHPAVSHMTKKRPRNRINSPPSIPAVARPGPSSSFGSSPFCSPLGMKRLHRVRRTRSCPKGSDSSSSEKPSYNYRASLSLPSMLTSSLTPLHIAQRSSSKAVHEALSRLSDASKQGGSPPEDECCMLAAWVNDEYYNVIISKNDGVRIITDAMTAFPESTKIQTSCTEILRLIRVASTPPFSSPHAA